MKFTVNISDNGVAIDQAIEAVSIESAVAIIEAQIRETESGYNDEDQRKEWDGAIIDGTAMYRLHNGGQDSEGCARVTITEDDTPKIIGWTKNGQPIEAPEGIHAEDFFRDGEYLGADPDGIEPVFASTTGSYTVYSEGADSESDDRNYISSLYDVEPR